LATNIGNFDFLTAQVADPGTSWSIGTFGAIAEFVRNADEPVETFTSHTSASVVTPRGGIRVDANADAMLWASESQARKNWDHRVALCLRKDQCSMNRRAVLTELGRDTKALRKEDQESILFDLGLDCLQVDLCIRVADPVVVAKLRTCAGRSLLEPGNPAMGLIVSEGPHRVFKSRIGRVEVYQPIPPAHGKSPDGPHTHVLPKLLMHKRTHPATELIPKGWIPCAHLYPAHPKKDALGHSQNFDRARHDAFQTILERFGDPILFALKRDVIKAVSLGQVPASVPIAHKRLAKGTVRVALRQLQALGIATLSLPAWISAYENYAEDNAVDSAYEACAGRAQSPPRISDMSP